MSMPTREELLRKLGPVEDPEIEARRQHILRVLLEQDPKMQQQLIEKGRLIEARDLLREVLTHRQLATSQADEARIEACTDLATLKRWHARAVVAASAADALE